MAFWNEQGDDPKRNFRFKIMISGLQGAQGMMWWAKKTGKPNFTVAESKHSFLNHTYYWPGRVEWQTITMTLVDPVVIESGFGTVSKLNELFESSGYKPLSKSDDKLVTQSKKKFGEKLVSVSIVQLDADGNDIETWVLHQPWIKKITYGELDYENDDLTQMEVEFRYDYAICTYKNGEKNFEAGEIS
tara:strand:- start:2947 stop:3510 length:564 start_codon:yes stop_codon:yes gene_type:complete